MKTNVTLSDFRSAFWFCDRGNQFSYQAQGILFDYFEQFEEDTGDEIELDPIAICCEYSEDSIGDIISNYSIEVDCEPDELSEIVEEWLNDRTAVIGKTTDGNIIYQQF